MKSPRQGQHADTRSSADFKPAPRRAFRGYGENMIPVVRQPEEEQGNLTPAQGVVAAARQAGVRAETHVKTDTASVSGT